VGVGLLLVSNVVQAGSEPRGLGIGVGLAVAIPVGADSVGVATGYTVNPRAGYELPFGLTPMFGISYSRWDSIDSTRWELSALSGLNWKILPGRLGRLYPWIEGGAGYGQLVDGNSVDIGLRLETAAGLDLGLGSRVLVGAHLGLNQFNASGGTAHDSTWLDIGAGIAFHGF
jgi:hypothetical protein